MRRAALLLAAALAASGCDTVVPGFFRPATEISPDRTAPSFSDPNPGPEVAVVGGDAFTIDVTDPSVDGAPASGVDPASIQVNLLGGPMLPTTVALPRITIDVSVLDDGPVQIGVAVADLAGNTTLYIFSHALDRTAPQLSFPAPAPPDAIVTDEEERTIPIRVRVEEPHFESGSISATTPGADDTCGTADDGAIPDDVLPVAEYPIPSDGVTSAPFTFDNPVDPGGTPTTETYCWVVVAVDSAVAPDGTPGINEATLTARTDVTWQPPS